MSFLPPPSSLPLNHCLCVPSWGTPFGRALGKKWGALPYGPLQPCLLVLSPRARCLLGTGTERSFGGLGRGKRLRRLAQPPTEGVPGWPDSRSVIVHFLLGCGSFLGPLCLHSFPGWSPSSSPSSFPPPPLFLGQVDQSSWKQAGLQLPCFSHLPPNPQLTLGPGRMKASTPTTQHGSEG